MGHQDPFAFTDNYTPAPDIARFRCGTPGILGMAALENGVDLFAQTSIKALRQKAIALSQLFMDLMAKECGDFGFTLASPEKAAQRAAFIILLKFSENIDDVKPNSVSLDMAIASSKVLNFMTGKTGPKTSS